MGSGTDPDSGTQPNLTFSPRAVTPLTALHHSPRCPAQWRCRWAIRGEPDFLRQGHAGYNTAAEREADIAAHYEIYSGTAQEILDAARSTPDPAGAGLREALEIIAADDPPSTAYTHAPVVVKRRNIARAALKRAALAQSSDGPVREPDWALADGTLRDRLVYARDQHALAASWLDAGLTFKPKPADWHRVCADWYDQMVRDLDAILAQSSDGSLDAALDKADRLLAELSLDLHYKRLPVGNVEAVIRRVDDCRDPLIRARAEQRAARLTEHSDAPDALGAGQ